MSSPTPAFRSIYIFLLLSLLCTWTGKAQSINKQEIASTHYKKGEELLAVWKLDSAVLHYKKALKLYESSGNLKKVSDCYDKIAETQRKNYDLKEALVNANKALELRLKIFGDEHAEVALSHSSIGNILRLQDQFNSALDHFQKGHAIALNTLNKNHQTIAESLHGIGTVYHHLAKYDQAMKNYDEALQIRLKVFGKHHPKIAESYIDIGTTNYHLGKYNEALKYYRKALEVRKTVSEENSVEVGICHDLIGNILNRQHKYEKSVQNINTALDIFKEKVGNNHPFVGISYYSLSKVLRFEGKQNQSLNYAQNALSILIPKIGINHTQIIDIKSNMAITYNLKGAYNKALEINLMSLNTEMKVRGKTHPYIGSKHNNIGLIYYKKGEYNKALLHYKKAMDIFISVYGKHSTAVATTYNNIGNLYKRKEKYNEAIMYYNKSLEIRTVYYGEYYPETAYSYRDLAELYGLINNYESAYYFQLKALKVMKKLYKKPTYYISDMYDTFALLQYQNKEIDKAFQTLQKSIQNRMATDGSKHPRTAKTYNLLAKVTTDRKQLENSLGHYHNAITSNTKSKVNTAKFSPQNYFDHNTLLLSLQGKAQTLASLFESTKNRNYLISAIEVYQNTDILIDEIRQGLHSYQDKIDFAQKAQQTYSAAIETQQLLYQKTGDQKDLEKAFYYAEKSRANTLKSLLAASNASHFSGLPKNITSFEQQLKADYAYYNSAIANERIQQNPDSLKIVTYENHLFDVIGKRDSLVQVLEKEYPKYHQLKHQNEIISIHDIQQKIDEKTTVLEYFVADSISYVFTISKNDFNITTLNTKNVLDNIQVLRKSIASQNTASYKRVSHNIYKQLLSPIQNQLKGDRLIIIPDGPLWHINFDILLTDNSDSNNPKALPYLIQQYTTSYANSATLLFPEQQQIDNQKRKECLAFSFSDDINQDKNETISLATLRNSKKDLPGTRKEIKAISNIINGDYFFGQQAIESNFKKNAAQYNILHLAMHGEVDHERPQNSKLLFTPIKDTIEDNFLYAHELFAMQIPAELTVLSACNTGTGKIAKGEGIMSLGNAFQYAGTKSLVLSNWEISDQTTPDLMKYFYTNLKNGIDKAQALRQAKLQCLDLSDPNKSHPFYWAGFYLVGNSDPIQFENDLSVYWIIGILSAVALLFVIFLKRKRSISGK